QPLRHASSLPGHTLTDFEHDGTLNAVAMTIRGETAFGARFNRATTLYQVGPRTRTMMQSCASAAKLRSGGPILPFGVRAKGRLGIPPPPTVLGVPSQAVRTRPKLSWCLQRPPLLCRTQNDAIRDNALPHETPTRD